MLTQELLKLHLAYDPATGYFYRSGNIPAGRIATKGYRQIMVCGKRYMAHRLVWLYQYGAFPPYQIDHINGLKDDNRLVNLRVTDNQQNSENVATWGHNKTGRRGVSVTSNGQFQSDIKINGKTKYLGRFDNIVDAVAARMRAERECFSMLEYAPSYTRITHDGKFPLEIVPIRERPRAPKQCN